MFWPKDLTFDGQRESGYLAPYYTFMTGYGRMVLAMITYKQFG